MRDVYSCLRPIAARATRTVLGLAGLVAAAGFAVPVFAADPAAPGDTSGSKAPHYDPYPIAVLRTLDKITGRAHTIEVPVDQETKFGTLSLTVKACYKRPPEETPETAAFLIISDEKPDEPPQKYFSGWMFASSPALSALEHPVYDLWVLNCEKTMSKAPETQAQSPSESPPQN